MHHKPELGIIGGSGLYQMNDLREKEEIEVSTPFGIPSAPIVVGTIEGHPIAFLARHGLGHYLTPSEINYRANIYALKTLGVERIVSISACGSLREDYAPGEIVVPNQVFDFTRTRQRTFFGDGMVAHINVANPFCTDLSEYVYQSVKSTGINVHPTGSIITIEGNTTADGVKGSQSNGGEVCKKVRAYKKNNKRGLPVFIAGFGKPQFKN